MSVYHKFTAEEFWWGAHSAVSRRRYYHPGMGGLKKTFPAQEGVRAVIIP